MRAALLRGGSAEARVIDDPVPGPGVGGPPEGDVLHTLTAKRKGLDIQFGGGPSMTDWDEAFEAVCSGSLDVRPRLGRSVGLDEVHDALDASSDASGPARIVVAP